jgi:hypothetical protein
MHFEQTVTVHSENNMKHTNTPCGRNIEALGIIYIDKNPA